MPSIIEHITAWGAESLGTLAAPGAAVLAGLAVHAALFRALRRAGRRAETVLPGALAKHCAAPSRILLPLLGLHIALPRALPDPDAAAVAGDISTVLVVLAIAWLLMRLAGALQHVFLSHFDVSVSDNLRARKVHTQVDIVRKIAVVVIGILALVAIMFRFDTLREVGAGILASAGLAGLVLGFAAQRTLANVLAGFQVAISQPIRIDDVLVVEGEWGRVEEITLTYVVVRIWDQRRLILPLSYFLEKPFQNWTRVSADLLGSVYLYVDHELPVGELRDALGRIVEESEHWDGDVWRMHVTDVTEKCVEVRAVMSAADSGSAWELRCEVREKLLAHLRDHQPEGLPRFRAELERVGAEEVGSAA